MANAQRNQPLAKENTRPDIRVAVDFGTTYTGVSWYSVNDWGAETKIVGWPGASKHDKKVPTVLAKKPTGDTILWGFDCHNMKDNEKWKLFKLLLDPKVYAQQKKNHRYSPWVPNNIEKVHSIVVGYLAEVYNYISIEIPMAIEGDGVLGDELKDKTWASMKIDFIFSTPTTWEAPIAQCFKGLVLKSGFGKEGGHNVELGLTEAEAAAVNFCCRRPENVTIPESNILLIDAGGGTTDIALIRKKSNSLSLVEISPVAGIGIGSTQIDRAFEELVDARMACIKRKNEFHTKLESDFALKISQSSSFQALKKGYGKKALDQEDKHYVQLNFANGISDAELQIEKGQMILSESELKGCFHQTWEDIKRCIDKVLDKARENNKGRPIEIDYIVLSGGLGASAYILEELQSYIKALIAGGSTYLTIAQVSSSNDHGPTAVIHGLLDDRKDKVHSLREHIARANYGIIGSPLSKIYTYRSTSSKRHPIHWQIKYKDAIKVDEPITIRIKRKLANNRVQKWTEEIVWADRSKKPLPQDRTDGMKRGKILCKFELEINHDTKLKSGKWYLGSREQICDFELSLVIGPSGDCSVRVIEEENSLTLTEKEVSETRS